MTKNNNGAVLVEENNLMLSYSQNKSYSSNKEGGENNDHVVLVEENNLILSSFLPADDMINKNYNIREPGNNQTSGKEAAETSDNNKKPKRPMNPITSNQILFEENNLFLSSFLEDKKEQGTTKVTAASTTATSTTNKEDRKVNKKGQGKPTTKKTKQPQENGVAAAPSAKVVANGKKVEKSSDKKVDGEKEAAPSEKVVADVNEVETSTDKKVETKENGVAPIESVVATTPAIEETSDKRVESSEEEVAPSKKVDTNAVESSSNKKGESNENGVGPEIEKEQVDETSDNTVEKSENVATSSENVEANAKELEDSSEKKVDTTEPPSSENGVANAATEKELEDTSDKKVEPAETPSSENGVANEANAKESEDSSDKKVDTTETPSSENGVANEDKEEDVGPALPTWTKLMGEDMQLKVLPSSDKQQQEEAVACQPQDTVLVDFVGRIAPTLDDVDNNNDSMMFQKAENWWIAIGEKQVHPALEMGIRFLKTGETGQIWSHSKYAFGVSTRTAPIGSSFVTVLPSTNVCYEVTVKKIATPEQLEDPKFLLDVAKSHKQIGNDMFQHENTPFGNQRALVLYQKTGNSMIKLFNGLRNDTEEDERDTQLEKEVETVMLDCLNNIVAVHIRTKEYHKAKEAAVQVLLHDNKNIKGLTRAAKAAMLDPSGTYEEADAAILAAEEVDPENKDVIKLRQEFKQRKREYKQKTKEMMSRMTKGITTETETKTEDEESKAKTEEQPQEATEEKESTAEDDDNNKVEEDKENARENVKENANKALEEPDDGKNKSKSRGLMPSAEEVASKEKGSSKNNVLYIGIVISIIGALIAFFVFQQGLASSLPPLDESMMPSGQVQQEQQQQQQPLDIVRDEQQQQEDQEQEVVTEEEPQNEEEEHEGQSQQEEEPEEVEEQEEEEEEEVVEQEELQSEEAEEHQVPSEQQEQEKSEDGLGQEL